MSKRPPDESSSSPPDAANDPPTQADPTELTSEATVDVTPGDAGQTLADASADRVESTAGENRSTPEKTLSDANLPSGEIAADLGATLDSPASWLTTPPARLPLIRWARRWTCQPHRPDRDRRGRMVRSLARPRHRSVNWPTTRPPGIP